MKFNKRFCFALLGVSLMIAGCGKAGDNDSGKKEPTANPTKVAEATTTPTVTPSAKPTDDSFVPQGQDGSSVTNPDGTEATADPNAVMPDLSEMSEGCYISPDGKEIWKDTEDGGVIVMWSPYNIDESLKPEEDERVDGDFSNPTSLSKDSKSVAIVNADGSFKEVLDSSDEDYIEVYKTVYAYDKACLATKGDSVSENFKNRNKFLTESVQYTDEQIKNNVEQYGSEVGFTETFKRYAFTHCYFNEDKSLCRLNQEYQIQSDENGQMNYINGSYAVNVKKVGDKWMICSPDEISDELKNLIKSTN